MKNSNDLFPFSTVLILCILVAAAFWLFNTFGDMLIAAK